MTVLHTCNDGDLLIEGNELGDSIGVGSNTGEVCWKMGATEPSRGVKHKSGNDQSDKVKLNRDKNESK